MLLHLLLTDFVLFLPCENLIVSRLGKTLFVLSFMTQLRRVCTVTYVKCGNVITPNANLKNKFAYDNTTTY